MAGLLRSKDLFTDKWVNGLKAAPESGMAGEIEIFSYTVTYANFVPTQVDTILWSGKARVQPLRTANQKSVPGDDSKVQQVLVSIPVDAIDVELRSDKHFVRVTKAPLNPTLAGFKYAVREVMDSSNPIEKTFITEVITSVKNG